jgi:hypothetical protein
MKGINFTHIPQIPVELIPGVSIDLVHNKIYLSFFSKVWTVCKNRRKYTKKESLNVNKSFQMFVSQIYRIYNYHLNIHILNLMITCIFQSYRMSHTQTVQTKYFNITFSTLILVFVLVLP